MIIITRLYCFFVMILCMIFFISCSDDVDDQNSSKERHSENISKIINEIELYYGLYDKIECDINPQNNYYSKKIELFKYFVNAPSNSDLLINNLQEKGSDNNIINIDDNKICVLYVKRLDNNGKIRFVEWQDIKNNINDSINNGVIWCIKTESKENIKSLYIIVNKNEWLCAEVSPDVGETIKFNIIIYHNELMKNCYSYTKSKSYLYFRVESPLEGVEKSISDRLNK